MKKLRVAVLMGGKSAEREISLLSGKEVIKNLDKEKYETFPVVVSKEGKFELPKGTDVAFIALHGPFGEDGTVQGQLELMGINYTGSGVLASALGMDKALFKRVLKSAGIKVPRSVEISKKGRDTREVLKVVGKPPYFVKPNDQGSSVGASIVRHKKDLRKALNLVFKYSEEALAEELLPGKELTCGVMGNNKPSPLPVVEIRPLKGDFFDYKSKYTESGAEEIVPAPISKALTKKVQEISLEVYKLLKCRGFARIDFMLNKRGEPVVLEINTVPGLTPMSLMPKAAKAAGLSYARFLDKIIQYATK